MKIAIVAPSPVPFTIGGAENLAWGLQNWMNQHTQHQVEIIKLPSREHDFWSLIESYENFYHLDLSYFDMVISMKYPAWMVQHKNHVCYLLHRLRGLYDTYHLMHLSEEVKGGNKYIDSILQYMASNAEPESLEDFFCILRELKNHATEIPKEYFAFPAPFIRKIVHYMDDFALSSKNICKFISISNTVKNRKNYFPKDCWVDVIYPPSNLTEYSSGEYKHIFMVSRLDAPKRIDLLIRTMAYVKSDVRLYIAGTGPQEKELKKLAQKDRRIIFLGYVNDETVERYYSDSLVIPYFPYDEDYGLITLEAMLHGKPVITTTDAGGPTEFVKNNETGFIVSANPQDVAEKIEYFVAHADEAKRMGENARRKVKEITWEKLVEGITGDKVNTNCVHRPTKRAKITVTSTFPIYPPLGGGQARIFNLYKEIAKYYDVEIISYTNCDQKPFCQEIADGLMEIRIPKSQEHQQKEWEMEKRAGISVSDIAMISLSGETPEYGKQLEKSILTSDLVVVSHPYLYKEVEKYIGNQKVVYEAHNVEYLMKKEMLPNNKNSQKLIAQVYEVEKMCCDRSVFVMTCSDEDQKTLNKVYQTPFEKMITIPNGVDTLATTYTDCEARLGNKQKMGLVNEKLGLFMGSWHKPNLEACEKIFEIAEQCPDTKFLLMGSQCDYFRQRKTKFPVNVGMMGVVDEATKNRVFSVVDFALNPMLSGSGTNLKMFDYMAAGIPIISTAFGTRGIEDKDNFIIAEVEEMPEVINRFRLSEASEAIQRGRKYVGDVFDWSVIGGTLIQKIRTVCGL